MAKNTVKLKAFSLTRPKLQAWLESKHPRSYIGTVGDSEVCPIAQFLKSATGANEADVDGSNMATISIGSNDFDSDDEYRLVRVPLWAQNFVERIDSLGQYRVTAQRALKVLNQSRSDGFVPGDY